MRKSAVRNFRIRGQIERISRIDDSSPELVDEIGGDKV